MCLAETSTRMSNLRCFPIVTPPPPSLLIALSRVNTIIFQNTFTASVCVCVCVHVYATEIPLSSYHTHTLNRPIPISEFLFVFVSNFLHFFLNEMQKEDQSQCMKEGRGGRGEGRERHVAGGCFCGKLCKWLGKLCPKVCVPLPADLWPHPSPLFPRSRPLPYFKTSKKQQQQHHNNREILLSWLGIPNLNLLLSLAANLVNWKFL